MSQPHHRVFSQCEPAIIKSVKIEAVFHHLLEKNVIQESDRARFFRKKNGMKILVGYLRNRDFETFLTFVECILLAQGESPSKAQSVTVVDSMVGALEGFDLQNGTKWAQDVISIQQRYMKEYELPVSGEWVLKDGVLLCMLLDHLIVGNTVLLENSM
jgi:hypothetical protein